MKLYKALKIKKSLVGDIAKLKEQIMNKNSYMASDIAKISVDSLYKKLLIKVEQLTGLKFAINEANREIQAKLYTLSEYKALIAFWKDVNFSEGMRPTGYQNVLIQYNAQYDELKCNEIIDDFQKKVDALQEEIDVYNYTTEIPWGND